MNFKYYLLLVLVMSTSGNNTRIFEKDYCRAGKTIDIVKKLSETENELIYEVNLKKLRVETNKYASKGNIKLEGFQNVGDYRKPATPQKTITLIAEEANYEIIETTWDTIDGVFVEPSNIPQKITSTPMPIVLNDFDDHFYNNNSPFPLDIISIQETRIIRGLPTINVNINPILYMPGKERLLICHSFKFKLQLTSVDQTTLKSVNPTSLMSRIYDNNNAFSSSRNQWISDSGYDIIIFTQPKFQVYSKKLSDWHKMKGYDVCIKSKDVWSVSEMQNEISSIYNSADIKPGYVIFMGDDDVASDNPDQETGMGDIGMLNMKGDFLPELARGRLIVSSNDANSELTMESIVNKIIKYEQNPPNKNSFYNTHLSSNGIQSGYPFQSAITKVYDYLNQKGYAGNRIESDVEVSTPEIKSDSIIDIINKGAFLVYHYDHGDPGGWISPSFDIIHMESLSNDSLLPVLFSIDCYCGKFYNQNELYNNFGPSLLQHKMGGAVANIAASNPTYTILNDSFLHGMIDAIFPGLISSHEPIYTIGDILDYGIINMIKDGKHADLHETMTRSYNLFGDPTTAIWTEIPSDISVTCSNILDLGIASFKISNLSINNGIATLFHKKTSTIIGKCNISGNNCDLILEKKTNVSNGDTVLLTITSPNKVPFIKKLDTDNVASFDKGDINSVINLKYGNMHIQFTAPKLKEYQIKVYNISGKTLLEKTGVGSGGEKKVKLNLPKGFYLCKFRYENRELIQKITLF